MEAGIQHQTRQDWLLISAALESEEARRQLDVALQLQEESPTEAVRQRSAKKKKKKDTKNTEKKITKKVRKNQKN